MGSPDSLVTLEKMSIVDADSGTPGIVPDYGLSDDSSNGEPIVPSNSAAAPIPGPQAQGGELSGNNTFTPPRSQLPITAQPPVGTHTTFVINLEFPGQDLPRQRYRVSPSMKVRRLYHLIATEIVRCEDRHIRIYVDGSCLLHLGTVTDRHFPYAPLQLTVFLYPDCTAYVRRVGEHVGEAASLGGDPPQKGEDLSHLTRYFNPSDGSPNGEDEPMQTRGQTFGGDKKAVSTTDTPVVPRRTSSRI
jgi:hypothetical protein